MHSVRGKILVVDDNLALAENLAEILSEAGHSTLCSGSAEDALDQVEKNPIMGMISDFRLPGMNGAAMIKELRRRGRTMPVVVMSAYTDEHTISISRQAGAVDVLAKPIRIESLISIASGFSSRKPDAHR